MQAANLKLDELRSAVTDTLGVASKKAGSASEDCSQLSLDPGEGKKEERSDARMSSMVKRVVEATGHGLEGLLESPTPVRSAKSPAPIWTTTSHALRPISRCELSLATRFAISSSSVEGAPSGHKHNLTSVLRGGRLEFVSAGVYWRCTAAPIVMFSCALPSVAATTPPWLLLCTTHRARRRIFEFWVWQTFWPAKESAPNTL